MIDVARSLREGADRLDRIFGLSTASALMRIGAGEIERIAAERDAAVRERDGLRAGITAPSTCAVGSCSSQTVYPAPPPAAAPAGDIAAVQGVIDARGGPAAQAAWERLRAASPPAAPAPCPECGGCRDCLGAGTVHRMIPGRWWQEQIPCSRCAAGESARSAVTPP